MYFDGYIFGSENIFEINDFVVKYKNEIEHEIFEEKIKDISKILYSIILNIKKGMNIKDAYTKSDVLDEQYMEHWNDLELLFLLEYAVIKRHKDMSQTIYFMPICCNDERLLLCILGIERDSEFEFKRKNKLSFIKNKMTENLTEFFYDSYSDEPPNHIGESEWNYRKTIWGLATENNDYIKHSFRYSFRDRKISQLDKSIVTDKLNEGMKPHGEMKYLFDGIFMEFDIDEKMQLNKVMEEIIEERKKENNYCEELYEIKLSEEMLKWTYGQFYEHFSNR